MIQESLGFILSGLMKVFLVVFNCSRFLLWVVRSLARATHTVLKDLLASVPIFICCSAALSSLSILSPWARSDYQPIKGVRFDAQHSNGKVKRAGHASSIVIQRKGCQDVDQNSVARVEANFANLRSRRHLCAYGSTATFLNARSDLDCSLMGCFFRQQDPSKSI